MNKTVVEIFQEIVFPEKKILKEDSGREQYLGAL